jgi:hypothetical protein
MCKVAALGWLLTNANLLAGFLGIVGSILLAVPAWLGAGLREDTLQIDEMRARLNEPDLLDPLVVNTIARSVQFLRREQRWLRAGTLCLIAAFVLMSLDAVCTK